MDTFAELQKLRDSSGAADTAGLPDDIIQSFAAHDRQLQGAVADAVAAAADITTEFPGLLERPEQEQVSWLQEYLVNFYADDAVNPYVAIAARGPWIVTSCGAVLHDSGGYGMLGLGHAPEAVLDVIARPQVMANVMTASVSHRRLTDAMRREIGRTRDGCPFQRFLCMNSGSEAVTVAARLSDVNAKLMTDPGGRHAGKRLRLLSLKGGFHGRTERPAAFSDSSRAAYRAHLASFRGDDALWTVAPNDIAALREVFARAERENVFIESFFMEPVMGEGNPGLAILPEFYAEARRLTSAHGSLLLVDSIQAGLRATGDLSIVDYPGFSDCAAPDMETYSKALNAGQYPLSVLAMTATTAALYRKGIYGNTMTANPRALDVATTVLASLDDALRRNIRTRGEEFLDRFRTLAAQSGGAITAVQGTGLLLSVELSDAYKCFGTGSTEEWLRLHGIGVIHGGRNSLRFTPHFAIGAEEIDLVVSMVGRALAEGPRAEGTDGLTAAAS